MPVYAGFMKSYYHAHESAYREIKQKGGIGWGGAMTVSELGDPVTFDYLKSTVTEWRKFIKGNHALDLGCGTGTTAFALEKLGFSVLGVDISETAIEMAKHLAIQQKLSVQFRVADILQLQNLQISFDVIYDSHCLHCIVFDEDRRAVLSEIKKSLDKNGIFILDTMMESPEFDPAKGFATLRFDENYILWHKTAHSELRGTELIAGQNWCAQRRIYPKQKLLDELTIAGFKILSERTDGGSETNAAMLRLVATHS